MCQCNPVIQLNSEGLRLSKILKILFFIYLILIIGKCVLGDFKGALTGIILCVFLIITFLSCYYLFASYCIFFAIFNLFFSMVFIALRLQNKMAGLKDKYLTQGLYAAAMILEFVCLVYYFFLIYYCFQSYKEFKAISVNGGGYCNHSFY